jgi:hypothetical protein
MGDHGVTEAGLACSLSMVEWGVRQQGGPTSIGVQRGEGTNEPCACPDWWAYYPIVLVDCGEHLRPMRSSRGGGCTSCPYQLGVGNLSWPLYFPIEIPSPPWPPFSSHLRREEVGGARNSPERGSCPSFTTNLIAGHQGNTWMATGFACRGLQAYGYVFGVYTYV